MFPMNDAAPVDAAGVAAPGATWRRRLAAAREELTAETCEARGGIRYLDRYNVARR